MLAEWDEMDFDEEDEEDEEDDDFDPTKREYEVHQQPVRRTSRLPSSRGRSRVMRASGSSTR